jgi:hypothetical protein
MTSYRGGKVMEERVVKFFTDLGLFTTEAFTNHLPSINCHPTMKYGRQVQGARADDIAVTRTKACRRESKERRESNQ